MDALSDVLREVRLAGAVYLNGEFTAPWCVINQANTALCSAFLPESKRVVSYHLITEGTCWARLAEDSDSAIRLCAGDLLVVPQGASHILGSALGLAPAPSAPLLAEQIAAAPGEMMRLTYGGGGEPTRMLCGFFACDETLRNPLLAALPRIFKVDVRSAPGAAWLESSLRFAAEEAAVTRAGSATVLAKLSELLFVEAVRRCIDTLPEGERGWLAGLRDRFVGRALALMHARPGDPWTVDQLASAVGLSRSALSQRFSDLLGQPPMQYLGSWRLQMAARRLHAHEASIGTIAGQVGYESEAAFNRAFKREFGMPPASWRKHVAQSVAVVASADAAGR